MTTRIEEMKKIREKVETLEREEEVKAKKDDARSDTWSHVDERSFLLTRRATP